MKKCNMFLSALVVGVTLTGCAPGSGGGQTDPTQPAAPMTGDVESQSGGTIDTQPSAGTSTTGSGSGAAENQQGPSP